MVCRDETSDWMQGPYIPRGCRNKFRTLNKAFRPLQRFVEAQCVRRPQVASPVATVFESERERWVYYVSIYMIECEARKSKYNEGIVLRSRNSDTAVRKEGRGGVIVCRWTLRRRQGKLVVWLVMMLADRSRPREKGRN